MKLKIKSIIIVIINTLLLNNLAAGVFTTRLAKANLVAVADFDTKELNKKLNKKINSNKTKRLLVQTELKT